MEEQNLSYFERFRKIKLGQLPKEAVPKPKKRINPISPKKAQELKDAKLVGSADSLDEWFEGIKNRHWGLLSYCPCMECGLAIPVDFSRHATAHLLPKKIFKSISTHPLNYLILGAGCGCHDKTHTISKFVKMKIWPLAKQRILEMMPLLPVDELRRISNQMLIALDMTEK